MVLTANSRSPSFRTDDAATVMASIASATASSEWVGSKKMLEAMTVTKRVMGGRVEVVSSYGFCASFALLVGRAGGYSGLEASQSSLKRGSSSWEEMGAGNRVDERAR